MFLFDGQLEFLIFNYFLYHFDTVEGSAFDKLWYFGNCVHFLEQIVLGYFQNLGIVINKSFKHVEETDGNLESLAHLFVGFVGNWFILFQE